MNATPFSPLSSFTILAVTLQAIWPQRSARRHRTEKPPRISQTTRLRRGEGCIAADYVPGSNLVHVRLNENEQVLVAIGQESDYQPKAGDRYIFRKLLVNGKQHTADTVSPRG